MTKIEFNEHVDSALSLFPGSVTSGRRSVARNIAVHGHPRSLHLCGLAVDIVLDDSVKHADNFIILANRLGLKAINEGDHIHVQIP